jgi:tetratricopeptide (TPR) repeat protein
VLTTASVIGREFDFKLISALNQDIIEEQLLEIIDEALESHLIEGIPGRIDHYQFSHVLVQQTLVNELSTSRQARLHARIGQVLEELYGSAAQAHAVELTHHFAEAETVVGPEKVVHYSLLAGEQALAIYAWEEAQRYFQRGLEATKTHLNSLEPAKDAEEAALLLGLGRAQAATLDRHQMAEAAVSLKRAFDYYADNGDISGACNVAMIGATMRVSIGQRSTITDIITRSLALVPSDSREAAHLLSRYAEVVARVEGDYYLAQEPFSQALTIARHVGDVALERRVLAQWANTDHTHLRQQECREKCLRIIELSCAADEPYPDFIAHFYATAVLGWTGELEDARRHAATLLAMSERFRHRSQLVSALWRNEMVSRLSGDWPAARVFSDRALAIRTQDPRLLSTRVELEYQTG